MATTAAWVTSAADAPVAPMAIDRRALRREDLDIDIRNGGVCHSDLHQVRNDRGNTQYPVAADE